MEYCEHWKENFHPIDNMITIKIKSLYKSFNDVSLFKDLDLQINGGELFCLLGQSGCGKTTLLRMIANLTKPCSGKISFYQKNLHSPCHNPKLGFVFQDPRLLNWETVNDNIKLVLGSRKQKKEYLGTEVANILDLVQLNNYSNRYPKELSMGQQQRVSIARALIVKPDIVLMDEPFSHLDDITATKLRVDISQIFIKKRTTVVCTTHNPIEAIFLADRIAVFSKDHPSKINKIIDVNIKKPRNNNLYQEFIYQKKTREILKEILYHL